MNYICVITNIFKRDPTGFVLKVFMTVFLLYIATLIYPSLIATAATLLKMDAMSQVVALIIVTILIAKVYEDWFGKEGEA